MHTKISKKDLITSPFPYIHAAPHIGNLFQIVRCSLLKQLRNAFFEVGLYDNETLFPYNGFHSTGIPIALKIAAIKESPKQDIKEIFKDLNMEYFVEHLSSTDTKENLNLDSWYRICKKYYCTILEDLKIKNIPNNYFTTTDIDSGYNKFVNYLYLKLKEKNMLKEDKNAVITCDKCKNIIGDHDRIALEGHGVLRQEVYLKKIDDRQYYSDTNINDSLKYLKLSNVNKNIYFSENLVKKIKSLGLKNYNHTLFLENEINNVILEENISQDSQYIVANIHYDEQLKHILYLCVKQIQCKCKGFANITLENTLFLNFEDSNWKKLVKDYLDSTNNYDSIKKQLLEASKNLRKVAFLRTAGFGSKLEILKNTKFKNHVVDSLTDSPLFPFYEALIAHNLPFSESNLKEVLKNTNFIAHITGKDLTATHVLYLIYFSILLFPQVKLPLFIADGHITDSHNRKMSKTLGNVVTLKDLKDNCDITDLNIDYATALKLYFSNLTDSSEDKPLILDQINSCIKADLKQINKLKSEILKVKKEDYFTDSRVLEIIKKIALNLDINYLKLKESKILELNVKDSKKIQKKFKLRETKYLVLYELYTALKKLNNTSCDKVINEDLSSVPEGKDIKLLLNRIVDCYLD